MLDLALLPIVILVIKFLLTAEIIIPEPLRPVPSPAPVAIRKIVAPIDDGQPWGVSKQLDEHTWRIKVGQDAKMSTANELFLASCPTLILQVCSSNCLETPQG